MSDNPIREPFRSPQPLARPKDQAGGVSGEEGGNQTQAGSDQGGYGRSYGYSAYAGYGQQHGAHDTVMTHVRTVYRWRWPAASAFLAVVLAAALYVLTATPIYAGRVQILIQPENPNIVSFKEVLQQEKGTNEYYQTQYTVLRSRTLARRTIDALKLWNGPEFSSRKADSKPAGVMHGIGGVLAWVTSLVAHDPAKVGVPAAGEDEAEASVIDQFLDRLTVTPIRNSRLVDIRYESPNPQLAAAVANEIAKQYIDQSMEYKFLSTREATDWLSGQLTEQRKKLEASEQALQKYREQGNAVALEDRQNIVVQRLSDLSTAYTKARTARMEKEALYNQLLSLQTNRGAMD